MTVNNLHPRVTEEDIVVSICIARVFSLKPLLCQGSLSLTGLSIVVLGLSFIIAYKVKSVKGKSSWAKASRNQAQTSRAVSQ